jgi:hypothetical protein
MTTPVPHRVFVFPYLGSRQRARVGPFELIPWGELSEAQVAEEWLRPRLEGFEKMYDSCVVFAQFDGQPLGVAPPDELFGPLRRAVFIATISGIPALDDADAAGWEAVTSDNAVAYVHPIPESAGIAVVVGRIVRTTLAGSVESQRGGIPKPVEMPDPMAPPVPDSDIGDAMFLALTEDSEQARRLALAIDWLDVAWRNTDSISGDVRILAIHAGFEALLLEGERADSRAMAHRYDGFLDASEPKTRHWTTSNGSPTSGEFSDSGWWLLCLSFLRNAIAHGDLVKAGDYEHEDGRHHLVVGERRLRDAILLVAQEVVGVDDLLLDPFERKIGRAWAEHVKETAEANPGDDPTGSAEPDTR